MKVKDLKAALKGVDNEMEVTIYDGRAGMPAAFAEVLEGESEEEEFDPTFCVFAN